MKIIYSQTIKIILILLMIISVSCTKAEETSNHDFSQTDIEKMLVDMKRLAESKGKIVTFEMKNFKKKDYTQHFEVIENSSKVLAFASGSDSNWNKKEDNYTVTCTWGNGDVETTECGNSPGCAGQATWDCLEEGGCATICNAKITYTPSNIKPNLKYKSKSIERILEKIEAISNKENQAVSFSIAFKNGKYWLKEFSFIEDNNLMKRNSYQVDCYVSDGEILWI